MFETLQRLFEEGKLDEIGLTNAVKLNWITEDQKDEILNTK